MSKTISIVFCGFTGLIVILLIVGLLNKYSRETYSNITEIDGENSNCKTGCSMPQDISKNCNSEIKKNQDGTCYKECPFECLESSSPYSNCKINSDCQGCGFKKFKINCDGTMIPQSDQYNNNNLDKNNTNYQQNYSNSSPESSKEEEPSNFKNSLSNNINHLPYFGNTNSKNGDPNDIKPECCGNIHYHYYMNNPNPSGESLNDISRVGGIISNKLQNGIQEAQNYKNSVENSPSYNSAYNYGQPGTTFPTDTQGQLEQYSVKYKDRPSVTGMYEDTGPLGSNIGMYGNHSEACYFPVPVSNSDQGNNM